MNVIYTNLSASISEFKKNPTALLANANGEAVAILNHNVPAAYLVPAALYEQMLELIEDAELLAIAKTRLIEKKNAVRVSLDDL